MELDRKQIWFLHRMQDWKTHQVSAWHKIISHCPTTTLRASVSLMPSGYTSGQSFLEKMWSGHTLFLIQKTVFILPEVVNRYYRALCDGSPPSITQAASKSALPLCSKAARRMWSSLTHLKGKCLIWMQHRRKINPIWINPFVYETLGTRSVITNYFDCIKKKRPKWKLFILYLLCNEKINSLNSWFPFWRCTSYFHCLIFTNESFIVGFNLRMITDGEMQ